MKKLRWFLALAVVTILAVSTLAGCAQDADVTVEMERG